MNRESTKPAQLTEKSTEKLGPHFVYTSKKDEKTGKEQIESSFSDGTRFSQDDYEKYKKTLKDLVGNEDEKYALGILAHISYGMISESTADSLTKMATLLPTLRPKDETEAMLLGQFLALQRSGMKCLYRANIGENPHQIEKYFSLGAKLFNVATQTMQTLLKYRTNGQQLVQVVCLYNEGGKAIVSQNLFQESKDPEGVSAEKK